MPENEDEIRDISEGNANGLTITSGLHASITNCSSSAVALFSSLGFSAYSFWDGMTVQPIGPTRLNGRSLRSGHSGLRND